MVLCVIPYFVIIFRYCQNVFVTFSTQDVWYLAVAFKDYHYISRYYFIFDISGSGWNLTRKHCTAKDCVQDTMYHAMKTYV